MGNRPSGLEDTSSKSSKALRRWKSESFNRGHGVPPKGPQQTEKERKPTKSSLKKVDSLLSKNWSPNTSNQTSTNSSESISPKVTFSFPKSEKASDVPVSNSETQDSVQALRLRSMSSAGLVDADEKPVMRRLSTESPSVEESPELPLRNCYSTGELLRQSWRVRRISIRRQSKLTIHLTAPQIHLVRQIWNQMSQTTGFTIVGTAICHRLFFKAPIIKETFHKVPLCKLGDRSHDTVIKEHARHSASLINDVIKSLDDLDAASDLLEELGEKHAFLYEYGFKPAFWNSFADALIDCTIEWGDKFHRREETRKAWAMIISFVVDRIKLGYYEQRRILAQQQQQQYL